MGGITGEHGRNELRTAASQVNFSLSSRVVGMHLLAAAVVPWYPGTCRQAGKEKGLPIRQKPVPQFFVRSAPEAGSRRKPSFPLEPAPARMVRAEARHRE